MSVAVLTGGVGGAKLVDGLLRVLPAGDLTVIVNTADDFTHLGMRICPDIDSVLYMLSGKSDPVRGWGVRDESWNFMSSLSDWGGEDWFNLGDRDLAMHVLRSHALASGRALADFTAEMVRFAELDLNLLPMSEAEVSTTLETDVGTLGFQHYFVRHQCVPRVRSITFSGSAGARPAPGVLEAISNPALEALVVAPSNPYLSVDPILSIPGIEGAIRSCRAPVIAVSPLVGGEAVKGPTAKLMGELGLEISNVTIAAHYSALIDGLLIDRGDEGEALPVAVRSEDTMMRDAGDRCRVAQAVLRFARELANGKAVS